ncbi:MAG: hypothetical protein V8R01_01475 [Bacilli bacterium]
MMPIIQITPPNIEVIKKMLSREYYDYDDLHLIYKCSDLGSLKEISTMKKEISDLKQALIDISNLVKKDCTEIDGKYTEVCCSGDDILQTIDKVLGRIK